MTVLVKVAEELQVLMKNIIMVAKEFGMKQNIRMGLKSERK